MISMVTVDGKEKEIPALRSVIRDLAAKKTDDSWKLEFFTSIKAGEAYFFEQPLVDISCFDVTLDGMMESLTEFRKKYAETGLMLITDASVSPLVYLKPGIKAESLLIRPLTPKTVYETLEEFIIAYLDKVKQNEGSKSYVIDNKEGKINLPYNNIFYFEAREKKVFARNLNEEYGFYKSMEQLEEELPKNFVRCHRSFIVNTEKVVKIFLSQNLIELTHGMDVPLSRSYKPLWKNYGK